MQTFTYREGPRAQPRRHPARRKDLRAQPSPHPERSGKSFDRSIAAPRTHLPRPMAAADGGWLRRGGAGGARVRARVGRRARRARAGRRARGAQTEGPAQSTDPRRQTRTPRTEGPAKSTDPQTFRQRIEGPARSTDPQTAPQTLEGRRGEGKGQRARGGERMNVVVYPPPRLLLP